MSGPSPLVIFHKQLGDVLLLEPALAKLAQHVGGDVTLATRPAFTPMLSLMRHVQPVGTGLVRRASSVISFDPRSRACIQAMTTWAADKRLMVTRPQHLRAWHRFFFPAGCSAVNESPFYRAEYYFNRIPGPADMKFRPPELLPPPAEWLPKGLPDNYILLHTTSAWPSKSWLPEYWARTLTELDHRGVGPFVVTGGNAEWELDYVRKLADATRVPLTNLCGKTTLSQYLAIVANARALLCVDGSSSHLAAAFRRPAVTLFGPSNPLHWHFPAPYSQALDARDFVRENKPAASKIPPEAVVDCFMNLLN